jgi:hypothetical protein
MLLHIMSKSRADYDLTDNKVSVFERQGYSEK